MNGEHGTLYAYTRGCRCEPCRVRHRIYNKRWQARARSRTPKKHGTEYAYKQFGCRGPLCVEAYRRYNRERMRRVRRGEQLHRRRLRFPLEPALLVADASARELAARLGKDRRQVARWRQHGLPWVAADQLAVSLGVHPALIWPEWWSPGPTL